MSYQVPQHIDKNKIFIVKRSEIEGRLEPEFYKPSIACLEAKIRSLSSKRLRDYALSFAGGVTPKKSEGDKYYSDAENGVPFLRVQNLQTTGELSLDGCIYINENTHNGLLKRSQVSEGDLLIKITGVGRMAIAAVAPKDFVGNTNQHMVVVKTGNTDVSKYLAHYLNLDIIEKIASRHSTGGTRPALDYPSLKNIPIIEGLDFSLIDDAIKAKKAKEEEAKQLLNSIDDYLLNELGIELPQHKTNLSSRIFYIQKSNCIERFDPKYNKQMAYIKSLHGSYNWVTLKDIAINTGQYGANEPAIDFRDGDVRYIRITDIDELGNLKEYDKKNLYEKSKNENCFTVQYNQKFNLTTLKKTSYALIRNLIKQIVVYDDKIEIFYYYTSKNPDDNGRDFTLIEGSDKYPLVHLRGLEPRTH